MDLDISHANQSSNTQVTPAPLFDDPLVSDPSSNGSVKTDWTQKSDQEILEADLIKECGLEGLSEEKKEELFNRTTEIAQKAVITRLLDSLPQDKKSELDQVLAQDDATKTLEFITENVPNYDDLVKEELVKFKRAMLTGEKPVDL